MKMMKKGIIVNNTIEADKTYFTIDLSDGIFLGKNTLMNVINRDDIIWENGIFIGVEQGFFKRIYYCYRLWKWLKTSKWNDFNNTYMAGYKLKEKKMIKEGEE